MKKNKDILWLIGLVLIVVLLGSWGNIFGSTTDWLSQHTSFFSYFRSLILENHTLNLPNLAIHLGAGENIFYFSYYGLYNPIVLFSCFFPHIPMAHFLIIIMIFFLILDVILFHRWLQYHQFSRSVCLVSSILFIMALPLIFQSHRQIMFVSYFPFLLLSLCGVDEYMDKRRLSILAIGITLLFLTSYYYALGSSIVLFFYFLYRNIKNKQTFKEWKKSILGIIPSVLTGLLMAMILLLPTFYVILNGRSETSINLSIKSILPRFDIKTLLYDSYGLGLTFISFFALGYGVMQKEKEKKILSILIAITLSSPLLILLLNGGLYIRPKVLIPFLPLLGLLIANLLEDIKKNQKKIPIKLLTFLSLCYIFLSFLFYTKDGYIVLALIDLGVLLFSFFLYQKKKKFIYFVIPICLVAIIYNVSSNKCEKYISHSLYDALNNEEIVHQLGEIYQKDKEISLYRTNKLTNASQSLNKIYDLRQKQTSVYSSVENQYFAKFYQEQLFNAIPSRNNLMLTSSSSLLFNTFMGVKYLIGKNHIPNTYQKIEATTDLYQNIDVYPMIYGSTKLVNKATFDTSDKIGKTNFLMFSTVVDDTKNEVVEEKIKEDNTYIDFQQLIKQLDGKKIKDGYQFHLAKRKKMTLSLTKPLENNLLLISFQIKNKVSCQEVDRFIEINGLSNKVTCDDWLYKNDNYQFDYVISDTNDSIDMVIEKGDYEIGDIHLYTLDVNELKKRKNELTVVSNFTSKKDKFTFDITLDDDGYLVTSLPYDEGYTIKVDDSITKKELVNTAFLGAKLDKGTHHIEITYQAPLSRFGKMLSEVGVICFITLMILDNKNRRKENAKIFWTKNSRE